MGGYRGMSGYWNEYGTGIRTSSILPHFQQTVPFSTWMHQLQEWSIEHTEKHAEIHKIPYMYMDDDKVVTSAG